MTNGGIDTFQRPFPTLTPAGSTVLFAESLIHATGQEPSAEFLAGAPEQVRDYLVGRRQWGWAPRFRELGGRSAAK